MYVYLQPVPFEAERIAFSIEATSAVNDRGSETPLELRFTAVGHADNRRQRLLASGRLPEGGYAGLSIKAAKASVRRENGEAALLVPDTAVRVGAPFVVPRGKAVVLWLEFRHPDATAGGASFDPEYVAYVAPRPMLSLAGFVSSTTANAVTAFDKKRRQAAAVIPTGGSPAGMALDQRSGRLYVACPRADEIVTIDVAAAEILERERLLPGDGPREIALTPDGRVLVSANTGSNSVSVFDAVPLTRLERINVGSGPGSITIDPTGRRAFVFNTLSSSISVIDIARRSLVATIATDSAPLRGHFSGRGDRLFVVHDRSPYVTVVDPLQLTILRRARLRGTASAIQVDSRRGLVYMGGPNDARVEFYDPNTLLPVDSMRIRGGATHLAIDAETNSLYVVSPETKSVLIGGLADRKVVAEIDVGAGPYWVAVMGEK